MKKKFFKALPTILPLVLLATFAAVVLLQPKPSEKTNHFMVERTGLQKEPGYLPSDWLARQRAYPQGRIKSASYLTAMRQANQMHQQATRGTYTWNLPDHSI